MTTPLINPSIRVSQAEDDVLQSVSPAKSSKSSVNIGALQAISVFGTGVSVARNGARALCWAVQNVDAPRIIKATAMLPIINVIPTVMEATESIQVASGSKDELEQAELGLHVVDSVGGVADSVATCSVGLQAIGVVSKKAISFVPVLSGVSALLGVAGVVSNGVSWHRGGMLIKEIDDAMEMPTNQKGEGVKKTLRLLMNKNDRDVKKFFRVSKAWHVRAKLYEAYGRVMRGEENSVEEAERLIKSLKGRVEDKITSDKVRMVATSISIISCAILLFTPLAALGFGLAAVSALIIITFFFYDRTRSGPLLLDANRVAKSVQERSKNRVKEQAEELIASGRKLARNQRFLEELRMTKRIIDQKRRARLQAERQNELLLQAV